MPALPISGIKQNARFTADITLGDSFLLCPAGIPVSAALLRALGEWGFTHVDCEGSASSDVPAAAGDAPRASSALDKLLRSLSALPDYDAPGVSEGDRRALAQFLFDRFAEYEASLYERSAGSAVPDADEILTAAESLCAFALKVRPSVRLLRPLPPETEADYQISHAVLSAAYAAVTGSVLALSRERLRLLAAACLVHEIGMLTVPSNVYLSHRPLTPEELEAVRRHPLAALISLRKKMFPRDVHQAILEHHEREDGSGYPRSVKGESISLFGKIIAAACSYEAITSPRAYRSGGDSGADAAEFLRNGGKKYDARVIRALRQGLALYKVGSCVLLSNGKLGAVVDARPDNLEIPIVRLLSERGKDGKPVLLAADGPRCSVLRLLSDEETAEAKRLLGVR